jgi:hypothetical protein
MAGFARRACVIAALLLALAPAAAAAPKKPHFYLLGVGDGAAISDGQRDVAFSRSSWIVFYDFGLEFPYGRIVGVPTCADPYYPRLATLGAVGAGKVGWSCGTSERLPLVEDVATGAVTPAADPSGFLSDGAAYVDAIGSQWMTVMVTGYHSFVPEYYGLASGRWRYELGAATQTADLNDPALAERMCDPLHRTLAPNDDPYNTESEYDPYYYEPPYGVNVEESDATGVRIPKLITVQHCGSQKVWVVSHCKLSCYDVSYSAGLVTWFDNRAFRAYAPRLRRLYSWQLSDFFRPGLPAVRHPGVAFTHTRTRLIASVPPHRGGRDWTIWAARMPPTR